MPGVAGAQPYRPDGLKEAWSPAPPLVCCCAACLNCDEWLMISVWREVGRVREAFAALLAGSSRGLLLGVE